MKIVIIGGRGTIGSKVAAHLAPTHDVIIAGRNGPDLSVDITDSASILSMLQSTGSVDALVCIAGEARWAPFEELSEEDFYLGIRSKLMGQVNLVRLGRPFINPGGSFTLTTGILADNPVPLTTSAAMVNGAIHSFVKAAALELSPAIRINVISSGLVEDSAERYGDYFPGYTVIPMNRVVKGYAQSIEGVDTGQIIRIYQ